MNGMLIGCGQITWRNRSDQDVLKEIAHAGYQGAPGHLRLEVPASDVIASFAAHGLRPAPPYFSAEFWDREQKDQILSRAATTSRYVRELGCAELYVATGGGDVATGSGKTRRQLAGQISRGDGLPDDAMAQFGETLSEFARLTLSEGVASCFHNHVGSVIETAEELDHLLDLSDPEVVFLGLDTGHLAWAGADAAAVCARNLERIRTFHLKDVNESVRRQGVAEGWDYGTFTRSGIFAELGEGSVDFPAIVDGLKDAGFNGWLIVETDVTMLPTPLESAIISRDFLRTLDL